MDPTEDLPSVGVPETLLEGEASGDPAKLTEFPTHCGWMSEYRAGHSSNGELSGGERGGYPATAASPPARGHLLPGVGLGLLFPGLELPPLDLRPDDVLDVLRSLRPESW